MRISSSIFAEHLDRHHPTLCSRRAFSKRRRQPPLHGSTTSAKQNAATPLSPGARAEESGCAADNVAVARSLRAGAGTPALQSRRGTSRKRPSCLRQEVPGNRAAEQTDIAVHMREASIGTPADGGLRNHVGFRLLAYGREHHRVATRPLATCGRKPGARSSRHRPPLSCWRFTSARARAAHCVM